MKTIKLKHEIGDFVYLKTDKDQDKRIVIGVNIRPSGILYELGYGSTSSWHYEIEITESKDVLLGI